MASQVKDLALSLLWLWSLLSHGFDPWSGNFCMLQMQPKTKQNETMQKKKKERKVDSKGILIDFQGRKHTMAPRR